MDGKVIPLRRPANNDAEISSYQCECGNFQWELKDDGSVTCGHCGFEAALTIYPDPE